MSARKVLIVDDDAEMLETAAQLLRQGGFEVATYSGTFNRLNVVAAECPDLVLLDVNMPFLPGDELYDLFKDHASLREVPVVFFSSNDERDLRLLVRRTGAAGYISKSDLGAGFARKVARQLDGGPRIA